MIPKSTFYPLQDGIFFKTFARKKIEVIWSYKVSMKWQRKSTKEAPPFSWMLGKNIKFLLKYNILDESYLPI